MSGARMEQAWQVSVQGREEGERTLDVSEALRSRAEHVAMGSHVWKMHSMSAGGAKNLRKGR